MLGQLAKLAAMGAAGAGLMAGPVKLALKTGQKVDDAKKREADAEMKRESRGIEKPANFDDKISNTDYKKGGSVSSASSRADGIAQRGKTRGTIVMCGGGMARGKK